MFHIWTERRIPTDLMGLLDGTAEFLGASTDNADVPLESLPGAHAVVAGGRIKYFADFMDVVPDLKVIARTGIGYDNVDLETATKRGIVVCNTPDGPTRATAEHAITLLLCVVKEVRRNQNDIERGVTKDYVTASNSVEVLNKTLGLIGLGRIGGIVAQLAKGLGMNVVAYDPVVSAERATELGVSKSPSVEAVLGEADFISIHVPLTAETRHLMNAERLAQMKPGSYLINCSRGGTVDEAALVDALDRGHLAGAGLDVFSIEPPPADHPLLGRDNVVATPHVAGGSVEGKDRMWRLAIEHCLTVLRGERPSNVVNPAVYD